MRKRYFGAIVVSLVAVAAWWETRPVADRAAPAQSDAPVAAPQPATGPALQLPQRAFTAGVRDPFSVARRNVEPRPVIATPIVEPPKAPPLPYKYDGSGELQGKRFVYLARDGRRSTMVSAGDTIDGTYAVENVARDHAVLRYLPLGTRQALMYQAGAEPPPELLAEQSPSRPAALQVDMPAEVVVGQEFVITVALPGTRAVKATVEVGYDHEVLRMVGPGVRSAGRALVELASGNAARAQLRFRVLAETPTPTDIDLQVSATDASGRHIPVSTPPTHTVSLVLPGA